MYFEKKFLKKEILNKLSNYRGKAVNRTQILKSYGNYFISKDKELKIHSCKVCKQEFLPEKPNYVLCPKCHREYEYTYFAKQRYSFLKQRIKNLDYFTIVFCESCCEPFVIPKSLVNVKRHFCKECRDTHKREKHIKRSKHCRKELIELLGNRCSICNEENTKILHIHHIDKNRNNNSTKNFKLLCPNCHSLEHRV